MKNKYAIAVMLKAPIHGQVKTRLIPPLTKEDAAELYTCFIKDIFARIGTLKGIDIFAAFTPAGSEKIIKKIIPKKVSLIPQKGNDLGERLANVFTDLFTRDYKKIAIIGSDSPDLPLEYVKMAFNELKNDKIVFGPAEDGGYYLIAMDRLYKNIFKNIHWSTDKVLKKTLNMAKKEGVDTFLLPKWHDIDKYDDLEKLIKNKEEVIHTYNFVLKMFSGFSKKQNFYT